MLVGIRVAGKSEVLPGSYFNQKCWAHVFVSPLKYDEKNRELTAGTVHGKERVHPALSLGHPLLPNTERAPTQSPLMLVQPFRPTTSAISPTTPWSLPISSPRCSPGP